MSLADRLRGVVRSGGSASQEPPYVHPDTAAETLGGEWHGEGGHRYLVIDRTYPPGHRLGRVAVADCLPSDDGRWPRLWLLAGAEGHPTAQACATGTPPAPALQEQREAPAPHASAPRPLLFVDLETTGLAGGAGTCAFLVGCGWFEGAAFHIRQFFLADHAAEPAMLDAVTEAAGRAGGVVTYNGKSFDLPLVETRFLFHRRETPFTGMPHIDMLHPARRLWRPDWEEDAVIPACRLTTMEEALLGHVREDDVSGFEIPSRYFRYVRTCDARPLCAVLEHNRLDLLGLVMLTARAAQLLEEGPGASRTVREALGLGRLYERGGMIAEARASYARAAGLDVGAELDGDICTRAEALHTYAVLSRRERRYDDAAAVWRRVLELRPCPPPHRPRSHRGARRPPRTPRARSPRRAPVHPAGAPVQHQRQPHAGCAVPPCPYQSQAWRNHPRRHTALLNPAIPARIQDLRLPMKEGSLKFAILGDTGTGSSDQIKIAKQLSAFRGKFPFEFVLLPQRQHVRRGETVGLREEIRAAVQADPRRRREVLRLARQPRRPQSADVQAVQHERRAVLLVPPVTNRRRPGSSRSTATT